MTRVEPTTVEQVCEAIRAYRTVRFEGLGHHAEWALPTEPDATISLRGLSGIVEHDVADHVVVVRAGTTLDELQAALGEHRQCLPFGPSTPDPSPHSTLGGLISMNLPHTLAGLCGSWREWVIGMRVALADGTTAKCGSKAVKNVAGFDVEKLLIGARGSLACITEVTLRTYARGSVPAESIRTQGVLDDGPIVVQRTLHTGFADACASASAYVADTASCTIWRTGEPDRQPGDWVLRRGDGPRNLEIGDAAVIRLMRRAKEVLDPDGRFDPGAMGVV